MSVFFSFFSVDVCIFDEVISSLGAKRFRLLFGLSQMGSTDRTSNLQESTASLPLRTSKVFSLSPVSFLLAPITFVGS